MKRSVGDGMRRDGRECNGMGRDAMGWRGGDGRGGLGAEWSGVGRNGNGNGMGWRTGEEMRRIRREGMDWNGIGNGIGIGTDCQQAILRNGLLLLIGQHICPRNSSRRTIRIDPVGDEARHLG